MKNNLEGGGEHWWQGIGASYSEIFLKNEKKSKTLLCKGKVPSFHGWGCVFLGIREPNTTGKDWWLSGQKINEHFCAFWKNKVANGGGKRCVGRGGECRKSNDHSCDFLNLYIYTHQKPNPAIGHMIQWLHLLPPWTTQTPSAIGICCLMGSWCHHLWLCWSVGPLSHEQPHQTIRWPLARGGCCCTGGRGGRLADDFWLELPVSPHHESPWWEAAAAQASPAYQALPYLHPAMHMALDLGCPHLHFCRWYSYFNLSS